MAYEDMKRAWSSFSSIAHEVDANVRGTLTDALRAHASTLALQGDPVAWKSSCDAALIFVASDHDTAAWLFWVESKDLDETLRGALRDIHRRRFAGGDDLTSLQWDAAVRVLAALGLGSTEPDDLIEEAQTDGSDVEEDEIRALWDRWSEARVEGWSQLRAAPAIFCAFRRTT